MVRVSGGSAKGRRLKAGRKARPTLGRVKESLFDILSPRLEDCSFLDVFAGNGGVGIEALSRGAAWCSFVEVDGHQVSLIKENLETCDFTDKAEVIRNRADKAIAALGAKGRRYNIIFLDPPYRDDKAATGVLEEIAGQKALLREDGIIVLEHAKQMAIDDLPDNLETVDSRKFGDTILDFFRIREQ